MQRPPPAVDRGIMLSASITATTNPSNALPRARPASRVLLALLLPGLALACTPDEGVGSATEGPTSDDDGASSSGGETSSSSGEPGDATTSGEQALTCVPGEATCADDGHTLLHCRDDGAGIDAIPCGDGEICEMDACLGPCDRIEGSASNEGCSFTTTAGMSGVRLADGLTVTNPGDAPAIVELLHTPRGTHKESPTDALVVLPPGTSHTYKIVEEPSDIYSYYYSGGSYRLTSDRPVVVAQHSPIAGESALHESALLLPDHSLGRDYVIASNPAATEPSYFTIVATADKTRIEWTPPVPSAGSGLPIPAVAAGETGVLMMNRGDTVRIGASAKMQADPALRDLSGTLLRADQPIAVFAGAVCGEVPFGAGPCNHLFEAMIPLAYWG
ncbi:MAG: IgGFc-binding protein, partial [Myxococcales bacterium]|nr:IgGFc-binding protein [Myxococcales bacterium]